MWAFFKYILLEKLQFIKFIFELKKKTDKNGEL